MMLYTCSTDAPKPGVPARGSQYGLRTLSTTSGEVMKRIFLIGGPASSASREGITFDRPVSGGGDEWSCPG